MSSFTGLSYAELSASIPQAAAEYSYAKEAFQNRVVPFLVGWLIIFTEALSTATVAMGFSGYFRGLFGVPTLLSSITLIALLSGLSFMGIKERERMRPDLRRHR